MTLFLRRPMLRWLVPLLAVVVLGTAGSVVATLSATASDPLPARSAAQLLVDVQKARVDGLSGTVVQSASLGLPALPGVAGEQSASFTSLVSGSHTLRVWYAGPDRARLAVLGQLGESDLVRNGSDVWLWSSHDNTARHLRVPADAGPADSPAGPAESMTPQQLAQRALHAITPTTRVSTDRAAEVAGRSAYQLVLTPRDPATVVGAVKIALDSATHIPTRVQVFARGAAKPSFEVGFTSFHPTTPPASVFAFNPPPGATVTDGTAGRAGTAHLRHGTDGGPGASATDRGHARPRVVGTGWTSVLLTTLPTSPGRAAAQTPLGNLSSVVRSLPTVSGRWGSGHLLRGTLFSAVLTDDGRVAVGAVAPARLYAALAAR
jgi:outer membrane lipoprotein-sorting protein